MIEMLREYWNDESGLTTVEYVILLAVIAVTVLVAFSSLMDATGVEESAEKFKNAGE